MAHYPNITVQLSGQDGNAFMMIGRVKRELRAGGVSPQEQDKFMAEAMAGDYDHVLQTIMRWVDVE